MNQVTEDFIEFYEEALLDFYNETGDVTLEFVHELFDGHLNDFYLIQIGAIRQHCETQAEMAYYRRLEDMNG